MNTNLRLIGDSHGFFPSCSFVSIRG